MSWQPVFGAVYIGLGLILAVYARRIAVWDYAYDLKWKFLLMLSLPFRVRFLRISGILMTVIGLVVLGAYILPLFYY